MQRNWRMLDTGLRSGAQNIALDRALLEARRAEEIPTTLRFLRFTRTAVLGVQDSPAQELHLDYCRKHDVAIQRRITSGPAALAHPAELGWALYMSARDLDATPLRDVARRLCHAVATAVSALGTDARFRRRDEIEVDGRRLGGCGIAVDGDAVLFQGILCIGLALDEMVQVLKLPLDPAGDAAATFAARRYADLTQLLGRQPDTGRLKHNIAEALESEFDAEFSESDLTLTEDARYRTALPAIETTAWVNLVGRPASEAPMSHAMHRLPGGALRASVRFDSLTRTLKQVWFEADGAPELRRQLADLEAALRDVSIARVARKIEGFFASGFPAVGPLSPRDFIDLIARALRQPLAAREAHDPT